MIINVIVLSSFWFAKLLPAYKTLTPKLCIIVTGTSDNKITQILHNFNDTQCMQKISSIKYFNILEACDMHTDIISYKCYVLL